MKQVKIEDIISHIQEKNRLNNLNIMSTKLTRNGKEIVISEEDRKEFKFTGLHFVDFCYFIAMTDSEREISDPTSADSDILALP